MPTIYFRVNAKDFVYGVMLSNNVKLFLTFLIKFSAIIKQIMLITLFIKIKVSFYAFHLEKN